MAGFSTEAKVGVFVMLGVAILAYMTFRLGSFQFGEPPGYSIWAVFDQATGLRKNAAVERAGIPIGRVSSIELFHGRAKLTMLIDENVPLPADSSAFIRTRGVLGDKYVSIEGGSGGAPPLKDGQRLARAVVPTDLDRVMGRVGQIADDVKQITASLRVSLGSEESAQNIKESLRNIRELTDSLKTVVVDNQSRLTQVVDNLSAFTTDLREMSGDNKVALGETITNFRNMSAQLQTTITGLTSVIEKIDKGQGTLGALVNDRQTVDNLNATLASLKDVARKVDEGKGTLGRLVNDDTTINKIDETVTSINDLLTRSDSWRVFLDYRGEYMFGQTALRNTFNIRLQPKADKFYILGLTTDPVGRLTEKETITNVWGPEGSYQKTEKVTTIDKDSIKWNLMFGKRFYDLTARAGLIMSSGGFGLDYHFMRDDLVLTFEAYDFRQDENPHLKVAVDWHFWEYFYITAGWDDFVSSRDNETFFLGGGVTFSDDDLKFLLTKAPSP